MTDTSTKNRQKLQKLLRELFQFDYADLDFGIYRIMRAKQADVENFIQEDLLNAVDENLSAFRSEERKDLERRMSEVKPKLMGGFDESGRLEDTIRKLPIGKEYLELEDQLRNLDLADETEARIFDDLYHFFSRYYDDGDFLSQRRYSSQDHKFAVPYNGEEVLLHWANRDQYYVKTGEHFTDYKFTLAGNTIWFKLQEVEVPQDNVKGDRRYFVFKTSDLSKTAEASTLTLNFEYRPITEDEENHYLEIYNAKQSKSDRRKTLDRSILITALEDEILEVVEDAQLKLHLANAPEGKKRSTLGKHLNKYTARNTMDYFVHKDLGGFLRRELDYFIKTEVLHLDDWLEDDTDVMFLHAMTRAKVVRAVAHKTIQFLAQIENYQKRLFEKKKFVVQTDYSLTLDQVPEKFYDEILANEAQLEEWQRLYNLDAWQEDLFWQGKIDRAFLDTNPYLMIDTAFYDTDFKARLLATFDNLDDALDGTLIHSENFQALNLLQEKYREQVKCIYIDPPYNSKTSEILYKNTYKHSSWLSLMENRLTVSKGLSCSDGSHVVAIDENEQERLGLLLNRIFPNFQRIWVAIQHNKKGIQGKYFSYNHEYAYFCLPPGLEQVNEEKIPKSKWEYANLRKWGIESKRSTAKNCFYPIYVKDGEIIGFGDVCSEDYHPASCNLEREDGSVEVYPVDSQGVERKWRYARESVQDIISALKVVVAGECEIQIQKAKTTKKFKTLWVESKYIAGDYGTRVLTEMDINPQENLYPKSVYTVRDSVYSVSDKKSIVLDFFAGSGTTAHAVMNLNREDDGERKYILVEMGEYFDTVLKPRIQKVAFSDDWKDGVPQTKNGMSHFFKYQRLESYEDALNNIRVKEPEGTQRRLLYEDYDDYLLHYMLDFETQESQSLLTQEAFEKPFDYKLQIQRGVATPQPTPVDLIETFHYLIGMNVEKVRCYQHQDRTYTLTRGTVRGDAGVQTTLTLWRDAEGLDYAQEEEWAGENFPLDEADILYVNNGTMCQIPKAEPLDYVFRDLMMGEGA